MIFILDNGHGKDTKGKRSPVWPDKTQLFEWEWARDIVIRISEGLKTEGIEFIILVPENTDISLKERVQRANKIKGDCILISVHGNAFSSPKANGIEVFTSPGQTKSDKIAEVFYEFAKGLGRKMRSDVATDGDHDKEARFHMLTQSRMPAILTENGFYTNPEECAWMLSEEGRNAIAKVHIDTIRHINNQ